jgi:hypothetical protein
MRAKKVYEFKQGVDPYKIMGLGHLNNVEIGDRFKILNPIYWLDGEDFPGEVGDKKGDYSLDGTLVKSYFSELRFTPGDIVTVKEIKSEFLGDYIALIKTDRSNGNAFIRLDWAKEHPDSFEKYNSI